MGSSSLQFGASAVAVACFQPDSDAASRDGSAVGSSPKVKSDMLPCPRGLKLYHRRIGGLAFGDLPNTLSPPHGAQNRTGRCSPVSLLYSF